MPKVRGKILVLDDDPVVTQSCKRILGAEGYEITTVARGSDAIAALSRERFDLLISDIRLPDTDGISVLKKAKTVRPATDVVIITGYPTLEDARESIRHGALEYIEKPFTPDFMINVAKRIFDRRGWILHQAHIDELGDSVIPLRDGDDTVIFYKEGIWSRPFRDGLWEIGFDLRYDLASGEMCFIEMMGGPGPLRAGMPFARLLTGSGKVRELNSPMTAEVREINPRANDIIGCLLENNSCAEGWLIWLARVFPLEL